MTQYGKWRWKPGPSRRGTNLHQDFKDLISEFAAAEVRYLLVGGYAVAYHSLPRFTKDLDLLVDPTQDNLSRVYRALARFGAPTHVLAALEELSDGEVLWMGNPPVRVDILQKVDGVDFAAAFERRTIADWHGVRVSIISRDDLIASKKAAGRPQDLLDLDNLQKGYDDF